MAGPNPPYYNSTSKSTTINPHWKKTKLYSLALITGLCSLAYLLGVWQHGGGSITSITANLGASIPCTISTKNSTKTPTTTTSISTSTQPLDFATHHSLDDGGAVSLPDEIIKTYPPCDVKYSEYTPCEDPERSLKFNRRRLKYRERHCPEKGELLKCRVPAPHGYMNPFKWPMSRDLVWYANVPHKELTVEKAVQNWIRYEEDRFRFPGGGTMFPNGADAYIDDIGKLINLKDGSIRTAIDTGCG
ncbi:unnamed protein product, partial [Ilex paraguariensis]